jgi:hypothetical protein
MLLPKKVVITEWTGLASAGRSINLAALASRVN